jgi:hypothetical protein
LRELRKIALLLGGFVMFPGAAWGDDKAECVAAHEEGQVARRSGQFDRAREDFAKCQRDACPAVLRSRCAEFAREVEVAQPSIVVMVRDAQGADAPGAQVSVDGAPAASAATLAMGLRLNPGAHVLHVEAAGFLPTDKSITLPEGVKDMQAVVSLERPKSAAALQPVAEPASSSQGTSRTAAWAFAIGSGASLVTAGVLTGVGWGLHGSLESSCAPGCTDSQAEPLRVIWPMSFVTLGLGVASGVVATVLFMKHPQERTSSALVLGPDGAGIRFQ